MVTENCFFHFPHFLALFLSPFWKKLIKKCPQKKRTHSLTLTKTGRILAVLCLLKDSTTLLIIFFEDLRLTIYEGGGCFKTRVVMRRRLFTYIRRISYTNNSALLFFYLNKLTEIITNQQNYLMDLSWINQCILFKRTVVIQFSTQSPLIIW